MGVAIEAQPILTIGTHRLPDRNVALLLQQPRQRIMPGLAVRPMELDAENILVALPGLIQHEPVLARRIPVENGLVEHWLAPHRVEHAFQQLKELAAPIRYHLKLDEIRHWHRSAPRLGEWRPTGLESDRVETEIHDPVDQNPTAVAWSARRYRPTDAWRSINRRTEASFWIKPLGRAVSPVAPTIQQSSDRTVMPRSGNIASL